MNRYGVSLRENGLCRAFPAHGKGKKFPVVSHAIQYSRYALSTSKKFVKKKLLCSVWPINIMINKFFSLTNELMKISSNSLYLAAISESDIASHNFHIDEAFSSAILKGSRMA
jgi:hypothetical protein